MSTYTFRSFLASEFESYIEHRRNSGYSPRDQVLVDLRRFDEFIAENCTEEVFSKENADRWIEKRENESPKGHYKRVNNSKNFFLFIYPRGYDIFLFDDVKNPPKTFVPHIYTEDEVKRYFDVVDNYESRMNRYSVIQLPVLFRLLYCCGTRINETLAIKKEDVDLENGVIHLTTTKNQKERYIVLSDEVLHLMRDFADKTFYAIKDNEYIFRNTHGRRLGRDSVEEIHHDILRRAGIPDLRDGKGPRIHDWRHTFTVHAFKHMADNGTDMYVALPILSTYLGHGTIMATEYYLRLTLELFPSIEEKMSKTADAVFGEISYV